MRRFWNYVGHDNHARIIVFALIIFSGFIGAAISNGIATRQALDGQYRWCVQEKVPKEVNKAIDKIERQ